MNSQKLPALILRLGLAFVFLFAATEMFWSPDTLSVYTPAFVTNMIPLSLFMPLFGGFEIILAIWLVIGKKVFFPAVLATVLLLSIVVFNVSHMSVLFRNIAIASAALSLASMNMGDIDFLLKKKAKENIIAPGVPVVPTPISPPVASPAVETVPQAAPTPAQPSTQAAIAETPPTTP